MPVRGFLGAAMMANLPCSTPTANIRIHSSSRQRRKPSWLSVAGVAATLLLVMSTTAAASTSGDLPLDDEFRTDPFFSAEASVPTAAVWSDGKVSLAGLMSMQWARQELHITSVEYLGLAVLIAYIVVYVLGRRRNYQIAQEFIVGRVHELFCSRFLEAGPASEVPPSDRRQLLARDSCSTFLYYATGSRRCSGVLVKIELANRHDLFMLLWSFFSPVTDRVTVEVALAEDDIEPMVFAIARKRDVKKLIQDVPHLQDYAGVTRAPSLLPLGLVGLSETSALMDLMLHTSAIKTLYDHPGLLELMHVTDQNDEPILGQEETPRKALRFVFRLPAGSGDGTAKGGGGGEGATKMIELALDYLELLSKYKMTPGARKKAEDRRETVVKRKSKMTHAQRQERFQQLKHERVQREKEEYESLTPEQKRRRDLRDEKKAKKNASNKKYKMKLTKA